MSDQIDEINTGHLLSKLRERIMLQNAAIILRIHPVGPHNYTGWKTVRKVSKLFKLDSTPNNLKRRINIVEHESPKAAQWKYSEEIYSRFFPVITFFLKSPDSVPVLLAWFYNVGFDILINNAPIQFFDNKFLISCSFFGSTCKTSTNYPLFASFEIRVP